MKRNVEIVSLVYKSVAYLEFIAEQLKRECCKVPGWDVGVRVVLNDADPKVLERSKSMDVPITVYVRGENGNGTVGGGRDHPLCEGRRRSAIALVPRDFVVSL